jgi:hypothetical protein
MEIFKLLDNSNCRECGEKTCLAFAGAVFTGRRELADCPKLDSETIREYAEGSGPSGALEENRDAMLQYLQGKVSGLNLAEAARRVGADYAGGRLTLKVLGKKFSVDREGNLAADIHLNAWVTIPFLDYILRGRGNVPVGKWVSFRELKHGAERYPLFRKRCEEALKRVADNTTDLFDDMVHIFDGRQVEKQFESDISVVLRPLPRVPMMICYWLPEEGLNSSLNVFFDATADENLGIGSVFTLGAGLAQMFERLALRHGFQPQSP